MALSRGVTLLLSGRCNLSCSYCYQTGHRAQGRMSWRAARAALDHTLLSAPGALSVEFSGGEPLLEASMLRRAVEYVEARRVPDRRVTYILTTNGTLLTSDLLDFLLGHEFTLRISFDGIEAAQRLRGEGTFRLLDTLLDRLAEACSSRPAASVEILVTLVAAAIPHLAESVRYLFGKDVGSIDIAPRLTGDPGWGATCRDELERQVDEILRLSLERWRTTRTAPVRFLVGTPARDLDAPKDGFLCSAPAGMWPSVDPAGRAWACPLFASSLVRLPPLARRASRALDLGEVGGASYERRIATLVRRAARLRPFTDRLAKRSSLGVCADCELVAACQVCPGAICHAKEGRDPDRVPDLICAFNQVTLAARERFDAMTGGEVRAAWRRELDARVGRLEAALLRSQAGRSDRGRPASPRRRAS